MFDSVQIAGFRAFEQFEMGRLGRINLLVGGNSSGKTSVLEALYLLASQGDPVALATGLSLRGERVSGEPDRGRSRIELDVAHLFAGHRLHPGARFTVSAQRGPSRQETTFSVAEPAPAEPDDEDGESVTPRFELRVGGRPAPPVDSIRLTSSGGMVVDRFDLGPRRRRRAPESVPAHLLTTESLDSDDLVVLWDRVALTPGEDLVLRALRFVEPDVERIAAQFGDAPTVSARGGFIVRLAGGAAPVPIGSLGDGIWRMLALAVAITQCAGGVLLVDEIDTGLHYTVLADMWRLVFNAAKELDVQVFATSHSYDCIQSLATLCVSEADATNHVTLQRIEAGKRRAVMYTEREIEQAAARNIEVR